MKDAARVSPSLGMRFNMQTRRRPPASLVAVRPMLRRHGILVRRNPDFWHDAWDIYTGRPCAVNRISRAESLAGVLRFAATLEP